MALNLGCAFARRLIHRHLAPSSAFRGLELEFGCFHPNFRPELVSATGFQECF